MSREGRESEVSDSDVKELREIFNVITEFIKNVKGEIKDLMELSMNALDGGKLGEDVSKFYRSLVDRGVPKEVAEEMTKEYFRKRLESVPTIGTILSKIGLGGKGLKDLKEFARAWEERSKSEGEGEEAGK